MPRLNQSQREEIYALMGKAHGYELAIKYKVSHTTIYNIWKGLPPKTHKEALYKIRRELEKVRGIEMPEKVFYMWLNIYNTLNESLGDTP